MTQKTFITAAIALAFGLSGAAHAAVVNGSSFNATAEILGTTDIPLVGNILPLSVSVSQAGTVNHGADSPADAELLFANVNIGSLVGVNLGVLGVDWLSDRTFELIFDINPTVNLGWPLGEIGLSLGFDGTIDWTLSNITLEAGETITGVTQIGGPVTSTVLSYSDTSINIRSDTLLGLDLARGRQTFELTTEQVVAPVPLPAALPLLLGGLAALAGLRSRRKKA